MTEWITDRVPTIADGYGDTNDRCVAMKTRPSGTWCYVHYSCVGLGAAWRHHNFWRANGARPKFAVGQTWKTQYGEHCHVKQIRGVDRFNTDHSWSDHLVLVSVPVGDHKMCNYWYRIDGTSQFTGQVLVELVSEAPQPAPVPAPRPEAPAPEPEPTPRQVPRLFAQPVRPTWEMKRDGWHLSAIADDGTCWLLEPGWTEWQQVTPLPDREVPTDG